MATIVTIEGAPSLEEYEAFAHLAPSVRELRHEASLLAPALEGRTVWMVNSTAQGGGVAEMMPTVVSMLRELGVATEWAVLETDHAEFFELTKRLHNLIHGAGDPALGPAHRELYEAVNAANAEVMAQWLKPGDVLAVHDPQPMPLARALRSRGAELRTIWRCHIGLDERTRQTDAAWSFLAPFADDYEHAIFSAPEYIPEYFRNRATLIYPAIDPLAPKNRDLWVHKLAGVMSNSALVHADVGPVLTSRWQHVAQRMEPSGAFVPADANGDIGLLTRPIVTQISRWDRLKGFAPLLRAFALLKQRLHAGEYEHVDAVHRRRLDLVRLVLAGPDPDSVADDPEGLGVLDELRSLYAALPARIQPDVALLALPMASRIQNALMVNALQRSSSMVVQNSLREGFGLTITEAMWKQVPILTNRRACGPRQQIRDGMDGRLADDPEDVEALCAIMNDMLAVPKEREFWARTAQRRAHDEFMVFTQVRRWLEVLHEAVGPRGTDRRRPEHDRRRPGDRRGGPRA